jgi:hypothetical protein
MLFGALLIFAGFEGIPGTIIEDDEVPMLSD